MAARRRERPSDSGRSPLGACLGDAWSQLSGRKGDAYFVSSARGRAMPRGPPGWLQPGRARRPSAPRAQPRLAHPARGRPPPMPATCPARAAAPRARPSRRGRGCGRLAADARLPQRGLLGGVGCALDLPLRVQVLLLEGRPGERHPQPHPVCGLGDHRAAPPLVWRLGQPRREGARAPVAAPGRRRHGPPTQSAPARPPPRRAVSPPRRWATWRPSFC